MNYLSKVHPLLHPLFSQHKVQVSIKRDDMIHPVMSGNKWRKLKYNLKQLQQPSNYNGILSFGGSYSNHIHALAFACYQQQIPCIGIIRGEENHANNFTLSWAKHWAMKLHFVDRKTYQRRHDPDYLIELQRQYPEYLIVPEGGSNKLAISGVSEVMFELNQQTEFDTLITPVGSGGTLAGLIAGDHACNTKQHKILGIAVLKGAEYLNAVVEDLLPTSAKKHNNWQLLTDFHRGGYAKFKPEDLQRILQFNQITGVDFEPVYSGKMVLALLDLLDQGYFSQGEHIVLLHTGGMQGLGGMIERNRLSADEWPQPKKVAAHYVIPTKKG